MKFDMWLWLISFIISVVCVIGAVSVYLIYGNILPVVILLGLTIVGYVVAVLSSHHVHKRVDKYD